MFPMGEENGKMDHNLIRMHYSDLQEIQTHVQVWFYVYEVQKNIWRPLWHSSSWQIL